MKNKDKFYKDIIFRIAEQSECKSRSVGAIIVIDNRIIAEGWNSPPKKCSPSDCLRCKNPGSFKSGEHLDLALCQHAEVGAITTAAYLGIAIKGATMYCTTKPCSNCSTLIVHSGISEVYYVNEYSSIYTDLILKNGKVKFKKF
jgi:dCMP deaminase